MKRDVEGTPIKVGDFVWAALGRYNMMFKYEIIKETEKSITLERVNWGWVRKIYECENKVLKCKE